MPQAELQELLPAGRLLSSATRVSPEQYERAKGAFLQQVAQAGLAAQVLPESQTLFCQMLDSCVGLRCIIDKH